MSRRRVATDSSLELLLDTICNTFGGILFIAILVVVLLRMTVKIANPAKEHEEQSHAALELANHREQLLAEVGALEHARRQQEDLQRRFSQPESAALLAELSELRSERDLLAAKRRGQQSSLSQSHGTAAKSREDVDKFAGEMQAARAVALQTDQQLQAEIAERTQTTRLPKLRRSFKREVAIHLRYGKMYFDRLYGENGQRLGPNLKDFAVVENGLVYFTITPKPYVGTSIDLGVHRPRIAEQLNRFDSNDNYFALVVWDDSFAEFQLLKRIVLDCGFEYRLIPAKEGKSIFEGPVDRTEVQ